MSIWGNWGGDSKTDKAKKAAGLAVAELGSNLAEIMTMIQGKLPPEYAERLGALRDDLQKKPYFKASRPEILETEILALQESLTRAEPDLCEAWVAASKLESVEDEYSNEEEPYEKLFARMNILEAGLARAVGTLRQPAQVAPYQRPFSVQDLGQIIHLQSDLRAEQWQHGYDIYDPMKQKEYDPELSKLFHSLSDRRDREIYYGRKVADGCRQAMDSESPDETRLLMGMVARCMDKNAASTQKRIAMLHDKLAAESGSLDSTTSYEEIRRMSGNLEKLTAGVQKARALSEMSQSVAG